jgi:hypothetical protein
MPEQEHQRQTQQPLVIMVNGSSVSIPHGRIVAGQSVIWAVERGENLHIEGLRGKTDNRRGDGQYTTAH